MSDLLSALLALPLEERGRIIHEALRNAPTIAGPWTIGEDGVSTRDMFGAWAYYAFVSLHSDDQWHALVAPTGEHDILRMDEVGDFGSLVEAREACDARLRAADVVLSAPLPDDFAVYPLHFRLADLRACTLPEWVQLRELLQISSGVEIADPADEKQWEALLVSLPPIVPDSVGAQIAERLLLSALVAPEG